MNKKIVSITALTLLLFISLFGPINSQSIHLKNEKTSFNASEEDNNLNLKPGDIGFRQPDLVPDNLPFLIDHCLLFVEYNKTINKYVFIEASAWGVKYREVEKEELFEDLWKGFRRVKSKYVNDKQKQNAIDFAKLQIGKEFQGDWSVLNKNYNPNDIEKDIFADDWYCSELVWASYYNCNNSFPKDEPSDGYIYGEGIDLDPKKWDVDYNRPMKNYSSSIIYPKELYNRATNKYIQKIDLNKKEDKSKIINENKESSIFFKKTCFFSIDKFFLNFIKS